jgi:hypothetical protein
MSFPGLTVHENVQIAIEHGSRREDGAEPRWSSPEECLEFVGLEGFADVTGIYAERIAPRGAVLVPEGRRIFDLTVRDNLRLGGYSRTDSEGVERDIAAMESFFPILAEKRDAKGSASGGGQ